MQKIMRTTPYILLAWCLLGISFPSQAVEISGLYESELPVTSQGRTERQQVVRAALLEVLVKVSGNTNIALSEGIPQLLNRRNDFLQQYRYRSETQTDPLETGIAKTQQYLWVRFDKKSLDTTLRALGLAIWGRSRPSTLAWVAVEQNGQRQLLSSGESTVLTKKLIEQAKRRGIPLELPLLDLEERQIIRVGDVLGGFQETIIKASQRYAADAVLVGRLRQLANQRWQGRWTLNLAGREYNWTEEGDIDAIINFGIDGVTSTLATNFVRLPSNEASEIKVRVTDVFNLKDYARSDQFLAGLDGVIAVVPEKIEKQSILYKITLRGDQQSLLQVVRLSSQVVLAAVEVKPIVVEPQPNAAIVASPSLTFKLLQ